MNNQKYESINPFSLFVIFIAAVIVALPLRVYQLLTNIEPETGFWINKSSFTLPVFYAVLALGTVLPMLMAFMYKQGIGKVEMTGDKKAAGGALSCLAAVGFVVDAIAQYRAFTNIYYDYSSVYTIDSTMLSYLSKSGGIAIALEAFFAVLSAIFCVMFGIALFTGKDPAEYKLLAVMPVFWAIFRIMYRFMRKINFLNVSELVLELLMIVFLLMFFMAFAQVTARINGKGMEWKLFAYGLPAALFCLACFVPRMVLTILGKSSMIASGSSVEFVDLTCAVFVIYILVDRSRVFRQEKVVKDLAE